MTTNIHVDSFQNIYEQTVSLGEIAGEWDSMVIQRAYEIEHGIDQTHNNIVIPTICEMVKIFGRNDIIDVGCGLGFVTKKLSLLGYEIAGIDISSESINFASSKFPTINFINTSIIDYEIEKNTYNTCIANMVLHNSPNLIEDLHAIYRLLNKDGYLLFSIPHPAFWYATRSSIKFLEFDYEKEEMVKMPFKIRNGKAHKSLFTYFHRTLSTYFDSLKTAGFSIEKLIEPYDETSVTKTDLLFLACRKLPNKTM